ncbi:MAG TPA: type I-B CRISPR-associated protein Cas5b [Bryobacteraceae bacterium]|jgi:CRISPR-associated protein Cas5t|nr:type I-B CRISPR-associated protein Cas5b [Bryobacteraceae bacterium]
MAGLTVLKVESSAQTTSFRYPRVQVGRLPTFDMPPPATIYGHLAGVLGEWFEPRDLEFTYVFEHSGKAIDLETIYPIERGAGKLTLAKRGWPYPVNVQCETNIQRREFLLKPKLTLYLKSSDGEFIERLRESFRAPYFSYILGRSQDLATCHNAKTIELEHSPEAFFADTLVPFAWRPWVSPGTTVMMPAAIDYERRRQAVQDRYLQITRPPLRIFDHADDLTSRDHLPAEFLIDPGDRREFAGRALFRGLHFWPVRGPRVAA